MNGSIAVYTWIVYFYVSFSLLFFLNNIFIYEHDVKILSYSPSSILFFFPILVTLFLKFVPLKIYEELPPSNRRSNTKSSNSATTERVEVRPNETQARSPEEIVVHVAVVPSEAASFGNWSVSRDIVGELLNQLTASTMRYYCVITLIFAWVDLRAARTSTLVAILETAGKESLSSRWNRSKLNKYVTLKLFASHSDIETIILLRTIREIYRVVVRMELSDDSDEYFEMLRLLTNFLHFEETSTKHDIPADATFAKRLFRCFYRRARCKRVFDTRG